ncbi:MAG: DUF494 family protein [Desulfuromonadales bacterium]|nr:DUF494 family protein [Desulfuromonadales bacterium]
MRDRVLAIVNLITQMVLEERDQFSEGDLVGELLDFGFAAEEIDAAFSWMENMSVQPRQPQIRPLTLPTTRIFSAEEVRALSTESRGYLLRLRSMGVLDDSAHEEVIDRVLQLDEDQLCLKELKPIIALTLFTRSHDDWRREMECLFEDDWARLYH